MAGPRGSSTWWTRCSISRATGSSLPAAALVKNRFGADHEVGVFEMRAGAGRGQYLSDGVPGRARPVPGPPSCRDAGGHAAAPGRGAGAGSARPALCTPRRTANGVDFNRLLLIAGAWQARPFALADQDVFVNVVGGLEVAEPAADLAIGRRHRHRVVGAQPARRRGPGAGGRDWPQRRVWCSVGQIPWRVNEAVKLGFTLSGAEDRGAGTRASARGLEVLGVDAVRRRQSRWVAGDGGPLEEQGG